jgi:hypothetical protein
MIKIAFGWFETEKKQHMSLRCPCGSRAPTYPVRKESSDDFLQQPVCTPSKQFQRRNSCESHYTVVATATNNTSSQANAQFPVYSERLSTGSVWALPSAVPSNCGGKRRHHSIDSVYTSSMRDALLVQHRLGTF